MRASHTGSEGSCQQEEILQIFADCLSADSAKINVFRNVVFSWDYPGKLLAFVGSFDSGAAELAAVLGGYSRKVLALRIQGTFSSSAASLRNGRIRRSGVRLGYVGPDPGDQIVGLSVDAELAWSKTISERSTDREVPGLEELLAALDLYALKGRSTATLSSGQRQRLALASIAINDPDVLVCDHCFSALDSATISALNSFIEERSATANETWLVCLPQFQMWRKAKRVNILEKGSLTFSGTADSPDGEGKKAAWEAAEEREELYDQLATEIEAHSQQYAFPEIRSCDIQKVFLPSELGGRSRLDIAGVRVLSGSLWAVQGENGSGKSSLLAALASLETDGDTKCSWMVKKKFDNPRICYLPPDGIPAWIGAIPLQVIWNALPSGSVRTILMRIIEEDRYRLLEGGGYRRRENPWRRLWWIAASIAAKVPWLLLDEPTTGLDQKQVACLTRLLKSHRERGGGGLIVSHDASFLAQSCDTRVILKEGRISNMGPITSETAGYI